MTKNIEKHGSYVKKLYGYMAKAKEWIKRDKKELGTLLKTLTDEENLKYGYENGFIEEADYRTMKARLRK